MKYLLTLDISASILFLFRGSCSTDSDVSVMCVCMRYTSRQWNCLNERLIHKKLHWLILFGENNSVIRQQFPLQFTNFFFIASRSSVFSFMCCIFREGRLLLLSVVNCIFQNATDKNNSSKHSVTHIHISILFIPLWHLNAISRLLWSCWHVFMNLVSQ